MILLDRLIQISDHILNKEIIIENGLISISNIAITKWGHYFEDYSFFDLQIRIFIDKKIIEVHDYSDFKTKITKFVMNEIMELKDEDRSYLVLKYGKILLEEMK